MWSLSHSDPDEGRKNSPFPSPWFFPAYNSTEPSSHFPIFLLFLASLCDDSVGLVTDGQQVSFSGLPAVQILTGTVMYHKTMMVSKGPLRKFHVAYCKCTM